MRVSPRSLGERVRRVLGPDAASVGQGLAALLVSSAGDLLAGLTLGAITHTLEQLPGLLVLVPAAIGMRGNIFGALAARLGTSIHSGLFEVSRAREGALAQNVYAATLLTVATSVTMGLLARAVAGLLGLETVSALDFIVVALVGGLLSSVVVLAVTVYLSITSYRRGWDLDSVGAPLITAIGDVVTLPCLLVASFLVHVRVVTTTVGIGALVAGAASLFFGWTATRDVARRIVRESFPVLCIAIVLDVLAGAVVEPRVDEVFLRYSALLIIVPGFLENTGALGAILAARLGSKLHLGVVTPTRRPDPAALLDGTIVLALGITVYLMTAAATLALAEITGAGYPGVLRFVGIVLTGGVLATLVAAVIGYYAATTTFRFGFDPDNHTIPLVTSGMDLLGLICLVAAIGIVGVA